MSWPAPEQPHDPGAGEHGGGQRVDQPRHRLPLGHGGERLDAGVALGTPPGQQDLGRVAGVVGECGVHRAVEVVCGRGRQRREGLGVGGGRAGQPEDEGQVGDLVRDRPAGGGMGKLPTPEASIPATSPSTTSPSAARWRKRSATRSRAVLSPGTGQFQCPISRKLNCVSTPPG